MRSFSPSAAAFEGFRVVRAHPGAILAWAAVSLVMQIAVAGIVLAMLGPTIAALAPYSGPGRTMPPALALPVMGGFFRAFLVLFPVLLAFGAVITNAVFRAVLRPEDRGLLYLRLGGDELRLVLLQLAWFGIGILAEIGLALLVVLVAVAIAVAGGGHAAGAQAARGVGLVIVVGVITLFCLGLWLAVRFSFAAPMTFAERRVRVFGSWRLTRGRFWSLLGCYLLALIFAVLVAILGWIISTLVGFVVFGGVAAPAAPASAANSLAAVAKTFTTAGLVRLLITVLFGTVGNAIMLGAVAGAYRVLTEKVDEGVWG